MMHRDLFLFLRKFYIMSKHINILVLIYFGRPPLEQTIKTYSITFQTLVPEICSILIFSV